MIYPSDLVIYGVGTPPYSVRGLTQTKALIAQAAAGIRRTINGDLEDVTASQFRKYATSITCTDQQAPALEGVWPGAQVSVDCVFELALNEYEYESRGVLRAVVAGSLRHANGFVFYRPHLVCRVMNYNTGTPEYAASVAWQLDLEEI